MKGGGRAIVMSRRLLAAWLGVSCYLCPRRRRAARSLHGSQQRSRSGHKRRTAVRRETRQAEVEMVDLGGSSGAQRGQQCSGGDASARYSRLPVWSARLLHCPLSDAYQIWSYH